jgi:two-component system NarL family sensor kinase
MGSVFVAVAATRSCGLLLAEPLMDAGTTLTQAVETRTEGHSGSRVCVPIEEGLEARSRHPDLRGLADGLLRALESERARVTGVLGDEVISVMTMSRYLIEEAVHRLARGELLETSEALQNASAWIRDAAQQVTTLCSELRPRVLDDLGLLPALSWYLRDFSREHRAIFVSPRITVSESEIPVELKLLVFRIVQTALSNVARHSRASSARVLLSLVDNELRLEIEDNGIGFDAERWRRRRRVPDGCGLGMISRWVETSGGRCHVESFPRHGARVQVIWRLDAVASEANRPQPAAA